MNADGNSDERIVPLNPTNKGDAESSAESAEERRSTKRNTDKSNLDRTPSRIPRRSRGLVGVRATARKSRHLKFTALLHHINEDQLQTSFYSLKKEAAVGVDRMTWHEYETGLEDRIADLHGRIHRGAYRAKPSKRVYIEKADGRKRPLGIASLEDKIVQHAVRTVLQCIYEVDFIGFSYGFRPNRSQHQALDALAVVVAEKRVNWILDADIEGFFDEIDRDWLIKFLEHRVGDKRIIRLIRKWLHAGIIEFSDLTDTGRGTPQGAVISPLLANVYLHYVLDLWVQQWRRRHAQGECYIIRYADDFVVGFEHESDARAFHAALEVRMQTFGLKLHPSKTRLIEFGRRSAARREREGRGRCETFDFLGFTHIMGKTKRAKRIALQRKSISKRMRRTLAAIKEQMKRRRHDPQGKTGRWLRSVVGGWLRYHAVPGNFRRLDQFVTEVTKLWLRQIRRRSQRGKSRWTWSRMNRLSKKYLPRPRILHPYPVSRFRARLNVRAV
jgi:group II intron reverse transcriptase/maturase